MKTKEIKIQNPLLDNLRAIRNNISKEIKGKSVEQIVEFLNKKKTLHPASYWQKKQQ